MAQEVDVATLRRLLADVTRKAEQAQAKVIATIETQHVEFVAASDQVADLQRAVEQLQGELRGAAGLLSCSDGAAAPQEGPLVLKLRSAMAEHAALKAEMDALDAVTVVLNTMLKVQRQFAELDKLTSSAHFSEAANLTLEIAKELQSISAPDSSAEPGMVKAAKTHYYQRRAVLAQRLEEALSCRVSVGDCSAAACHVDLSPLAPGMAGEASCHAALEWIWEALGILGLRDRRVEQLAEELRSRVVRPLLDTARRLLPGQGLDARTCGDQAAGKVVWAWVVTEETGVDIENRVPKVNSLPGKLCKDVRTTSHRPCVQAVLPVLESLFAFAREHLASDSSSVYTLLGRRLWPSVASSLVQHFNTCESDGGAAIEQLELALQSKGMIGGKDKMLSKHVREHLHALSERRRASVLGEVRGWMLHGDPTLVEVCDSTEPGSITHKILQGKDDAEHGEKVAYAGSATMAPQATSSFVSERLRHALKDDEGFLRLPKMRVSTSVHKTVGRVRELMEEIVAAVEQGHSESARDLNKLVRELCTLFSVLRPHVQKVQLKTNVQSCAVFFADCLYFVHVLLLLPYSYAKLLPSEHHQLVLFVDLVPQLRRLGENHFMAMLRYQQEQLTAALKGCDFTLGMAQDRVYIAAEAALGAAVQQLKLAAQGLSAALPVQLFHEVTGLLLGMLCQNLLGKVFQLQHLDPNEVGCLSGLLTSALMGCRQVFSVIAFSNGNTTLKGGNDITENIPGWSALTLVADLLGSGFSRFLDQRAALLKVLKKEEVLKLMHLSWRDEFLAPDEAWTALNSA